MTTLQEKVAETLADSSPKEFDWKYANDYEKAMWLNMARKVLKLIESESKED